MNTKIRAQDKAQLLKTLEVRFQAHPQRHQGLAWTEVRERLEARSGAWKVLLAMESTGGEPDVVLLETEGDALVFCDCAAESPAGRRSLCYDRAALDARKENRPVGSAVEMAAELGVELLDEARYRALQQLGRFDEKTSSWILTPPDLRAQGGALFCDRRYGQVFTYHNGVQSYYAARAFRGLLRF